MSGDYKGATNEGHTAFTVRILNDNERLKRDNENLKGDVKLLLWSLGAVSVFSLGLVLKFAGMYVGA